MNRKLVAALAAAALLSGCATTGIPSSGSEPGQPGGTASASTDSDAMLPQTIGAIAGGLIGAQIGEGDGKVAAAAIGAAIGAYIGRQIGRDAAKQAECNCARPSTASEWPGDAQ